MPNGRTPSDETTVDALIKGTSTAGSDIRVGEVESPSTGLVLVL